MSEPASQQSGATGRRVDASLLGRLRHVWQLEFAQLRWSWLFLVLLARTLPENRFTGLRTGLIRAMGLRVGPRTRFRGMPKVQSSTPGSVRWRSNIGADCDIGAGVILEFGESLTIGDRTSLADGVVVLTTTHQIGTREHRAGDAVKTPVTIGNDVSIGVDAIVLPGAVIGDNARVLPNSVVNGTVGPGVTVTGIPARPLRPA
jgi:acetyltransferase-like isoleucine patch superfamily enzyme